MDRRWISHVANDQQGKDEMIRMVLSSAPVLERLAEILTKDLKSSQDKQKEIDLYSCPNWQLMQADCNATQRTLESIIRLLKVTKE